MEEVPSSRLLQDPVSDFLTHFKLSKYETALRKSGVDDLADLKELNDEEINGLAQEASIPTIKKKQFVKAVKEYQTGNYPPQKKQEQQPSVTPKSDKILTKPEEETVSSAAPQQSQYKPDSKQLLQGIPKGHEIVTTPNEPTRVGQAKDGEGVQKGCIKNPHLLTWIFTVGFIVSGILAAITKAWWASIFAVFFLIAYFVECCLSGTGQYLRNILQKEGAAQFVERLKGQPAMIKWNVKCYHCETRRRRKEFTDANGNRRVEWETYEEKVYTWSANEQYTYDTCYDVSGELLGMDEWKLCKLRLHKTYGFADTVSQNHYLQRLQHFRNVNWRDVHQEFYEEFDIPGYTERILAESEPGVKPDWMSFGTFWLCNLLGCSACFRMAMAGQCGGVEYTFIKQLKSVPAPLPQIVIAQPIVNVSVPAPLPSIVASVPSMHVDMGLPSVHMDVNVPQTTMDVHMDVPSVHMDVNSSSSSIHASLHDSSPHHHHHHNHHDHDEDSNVEVHMNLPGIHMDVNLQ